jgi:hypothetical protein
MGKGQAGETSLFEAAWGLRRHLEPSLAYIPERVQAQTFHSHGSLDESCLGLSTPLLESHNAR